jgi:hypothetical protein
MAVIPEPERSKIYTRVKHQLGAPLRSVELVNGIIYWRLRRIRSSMVNR